MHKLSSLCALPLLYPSFACQPPIFFLRKTITSSSTPTPNLTLIEYGIPGFTKRGVATKFSLQGERTYLMPGISASSENPPKEMTKMCQKCTDLCGEPRLSPRASTDPLTPFLQSLLYQQQVDMGLGSEGQCREEFKPFSGVSKALCSGLTCRDGPGGSREIGSD